MDMSVRAPQLQQMLQTGHAHVSYLQVLFQFHRKRTRCLETGKGQAWRSGFHWWNGSTARGRICGLVCRLCCPERRVRHWSWQRKPRPPTGWTPCATPGLVLAITRHRAETLKARPYDGDLARIIVPRDGGLGWLRAMADPADDLRHPMKGPFHCARDGTADLHRAAIALVKTAQLLPAALVLESPPAALIAGNDLTELPFDLFGRGAGPRKPACPRWSMHVCPWVASQAGRVHIFRPRDGGEEHYGHRNWPARPHETGLGAAAFGLLYRRCAGQPEM